MTKPGLSGEYPPKYQKENDSQSTHTGLAKLNYTSLFTWKCPMLSNQGWVYNPSYACSFATE